MRIAIECTILRANLTKMEINSKCKMSPSPSAKFTKGIVKKLSIEHQRDPKLRFKKAHYIPGGLRLFTCHLRITTHRNHKRAEQLLPALFTHSVPSISHSRNHTKLAANAQRRDATRRGVSQPKLTNEINRRSSGRAAITPRSLAFSERGSRPRRAFPRSRRTSASRRASSRVPPVRLANDAFELRDVRQRAVH